MKKGFTLIEIIIYVALLAAIVLSAVEIVLISARSVSEMWVERRIFTAGEGAMETILRDIRQSTDIALGSSTFGTNPGALALRIPQDPGSSTIITRIFSLSSERLQKNDDGASELLTPPEARITSLIFWNSATTTSSLVSVKLTIESGDQKNYKSHAFYGSAVLRAKY